MKPLKPSHREKKRYLLISGTDASKKKIEEVILEFIGVLGYAKASPMFIKSLKGKVIVSVNRGMVGEIRSAILISGKDLKVIKVSGTLKGLE